MKQIETELARLFPIQSQTSATDKAFLLASLALLHQYTQNYSYVEIGSFLGGSLTPFLMDTRCTLVLSIDERERQQPDERGCKFDYAGVTHQTMINNLMAHGINTDKLQTFDGSVDAMKPSEQKFDLALIDGEHTDVGCFRDFIWVLPLMKPDALLLFHDSSLVYKSLRIITLYLRKMGLPFRFFKKTDSEMTAILLGKFADVDISGVFGAEDNPDDFYALAETKIIHSLITRRAEISIRVKPIQTVRAF